MIDPQRITSHHDVSESGRLLFGAPIATLRGRAGAGQPIGEATVVGLWRESRRLRAELAARRTAAPG